MKFLEYFSNYFKKRKERKIIFKRYSHILKKLEQSAEAQDNLTLRLKYQVSNGKYSKNYSKDLDNLRLAVNDTTYLVGRANYYSGKLLSTARGAPELAYLENFCQAYKDTSAGLGLEKIISIGHEKEVAA